MKRIKNKAIINPFDNKPIQASYAVKRTPDGKAIKDEFGQPEMLTAPMTTALAIRNFIATGFDPKETSLVDCNHAMRYLDILRPFKLLEAALGFKEPEFVRVEDTDYEWFIKHVKDRATKMYGILAKVYIDAFEDLDKREEPAKLEELSNAHEDSSNGSKPKLVSQH